MSSLHRLDPWKFSFTPYGWLTGINGNVTARGHTVDVDESFIEIAEKSDLFAALMGYFEGAQGQVRVLHRRGMGRSRISRPCELRHQQKRVGQSLRQAARLQRHHQRQSRYQRQGAARLSVDHHPVGRRFRDRQMGQTPQGYTALDVLGSARYWNEDVELSLNIDGKLPADIEADFQLLGLKVQRKVKGSRFVACYARATSNGSIRRRAAYSEWMHRGRSSISWAMSAASEQGSEFSWQAVATYGFDVNATSHHDAECGRLSRALRRLQREHAARKERSRLESSTDRPLGRGISLVASKAHEPAMVRQAADRDKARSDFNRLREPDARPAAHSSHHRASLLDVRALTRCLIFPSPAATPNPDGSTKVYFGPSKPDGVADGNWIETVPGKGWFTILRLYSPLDSFFTKEWRPSEIELVDGK